MITPTHYLVQRATLLLPLFLLCFSSFLSSQDNWEVVKIRGAIYTAKKALRVGSVLAKETPFTFTNTSNVMLVRQGQELYFVKPPNFSVDEKKGVPISGRTKRLKDYEAEWSGVALIVDAKLENKLPKFCNRAFWAEEDHGLTIMNSKYSPPPLCEVVFVDDNWEIYKYRSIDDDLYPPYQLDSADFIASPSCSYRLTFDAHGNLTLFNDDLQQLLWTTDIADNPGGFCKLENNGNLVVYNAQQQPVWASSTFDKNCQCSFLKLTDDGNLQLLAPDGSVTWQTRTWGGTVNTNPYGHVESRNRNTLDLSARFSIKSASDGLLLGIIPKSSVEGSLQLSKRKPGVETQYWTLVMTPDLHYRRLRSSTFHILSVLNNPAKTLSTRPFGSVDNQQWDIIPAEESGLFYIRNIKGLYLENKGGKPAGLQLKPYTGEQNQQWKFEAVR